MSKHTSADSTLRSWTKDELIHQIRILEHNVAVGEERLNNQAKLLKTWAPVVRCKECERALEILNDIGGCGAEPGSYTSGWDEAINAAYEAIQDEPAADVAPVVHAYWKRVDKDDGGHDTVCSHCSTPIVTYLETPYCHNCGAKMDGGGKK